MKPSDDLKLIALIALLLLKLPLQAQFIQCIDSGRVNPMFQCNDAFYNPVCGCNGITYRNQCDAYNVHGVIDWRGGVCSGMDMDFYPNPIGPSSLMTVNLSFPEFVYANADIKIVDMYGKVWEQRIFNNFNRNSIQFDLSSLMTGVYLLVAVSNQNTFVIRKFAKY